MRVLLTGGSGFIGRHTVPALVALGFEVHALGRRPAPGAVHHPVDLLDAAAVARVVAEVRATHLLHLAWSVEPGVYWQSMKNLDWVAASLALVRAFADAGGQRVVGAGTCAEYEWGTARFVEEVTPCRPATLYGASKDALRRMLIAAAGPAGLSVAWGRIFYLYGPGEGAGRLVGGAIAALQAGTVFETTHGRQRRDFLHVADAGAAFAALLASDVAGAVNVGSGQAVPVRVILEQLQAALGGQVAFGARVLGPAEPEVIEADVARLRSVGFVPRFTLESGLADVLSR